MVAVLFKVHVVVWEKRQINCWVRAMDDRDRSDGMNRWAIDCVVVGDDDDGDDEGPESKRMMVVVDGQSQMKVF